MSGFLRALVLIAAWTQSAGAHAPIEGVGGFYGGLLHPILVPAHALGLLALGLFIARQESRRGPILIFAAALVAGLGAIALAVGPTPAEEILLANTVVIGTLVAIALPPPRPVGWLAAAVTGAALGLDSPPDEISIALATLALIGTGLAACIALALVIGLTARARRDWQRLGARILGSWIAASAMLVLAVRLAR
jgi:urease accessory protein